MVALYVGGKRVSWEDAERLIPESFARNESVEIRDDDGVVVGICTPVPPAEYDPFADITPEEAERLMNEPAYTFEEVKKRLGWE